jgi:cytochrome d ubiquinol oxidase subunit II
MGLGLVAYAVSGGADLGAGLWSLLARGPRKEAQRQAVRQAIAPIWEANHVWLIFVIVVMFSAFSRAFAVISIALHIPIALALLGIVLRGAAFVFRAYGIQGERAERGWERTFAWASLATPILLGTVVGALSSGRIRVIDGEVTTGYLAGWLTPLAWIVGLFALALFALLAAVYLAADTEGELADDFRRRALVMEAIAAVLALVTFVRSASEAPGLYDNLARSPWTWPVQAATAACALATVALLLRRRPRLARYTVAVQVALVVLGWGLAMDGHFVLPDVSLAGSSPNPEVMPALALALGLGSLILGPALFYLYRVFKTRGAS